MTLTTTEILPPAESGPATAAELGGREHRGSLRRRSRLPNGGQAIHLPRRTSSPSGSPGSGIGTWLALSARIPRSSSPGQANAGSMASRPRPIIADQPLATTRS